MNSPLLASERNIASLEISLFEQKISTFTLELPWPQFLTSLYRAAAGEATAQNPRNNIFAGRCSSRIARYLSNSASPLELTLSWRTASDIELWVGKVAQQE